MTTAKWASPTGVPFLGQDRETTGVKPTVEVKRPDTPEPVEVQELIDQQEDENNTSPSDRPRTSPSPEATKAPVEDVQMKKAIELLQDKTGAVRSGN
ncbi:hypothetical protein [Leptolyngbya sp. 7M]|uniref:hypothetical protein n=1 Tax=Leptolyngbya sp. 7M TaxID=2812896 RepID=UPI001B8C5C7C|nr:hypothetical protein [Leptolyngbya sp. 7M]QYO62424.1 hypothetical protein JVX88_20340 [Leptolyngbya sp. 7M]